ISTTDAFVVGMELLDILSGLQDGGPVVAVVEDLHWADLASRQALLATAHRLHDDAVLLVVTSRPGAGDVDGWNRLRTDPDQCLDVRLEPLTARDIAALAATAGLVLSGTAIERLHRHTGGHALYVRTLLAQLSPAQLASPDDELPVPRSLS